MSELFNDVLAIIFSYVERVETLFTCRVVNKTWGFVLFDEKTDEIIWKPKWELERIRAFIYKQYNMISHEVSDNTIVETESEEDWRVSRGFLQYEHEKKRKRKKKKTPEKKERKLPLFRQLLTNLREKVWEEVFMEFSSDIIFEGREGKAFVVLSKGILKLFEDKFKHRVVGKFDLFDCTYYCTESRYYKIITDDGCDIHLTIVQHSEDFFKFVMKQFGGTFLGSEDEVLSTKYKDKTHEEGLENATRKVTEAFVNRGMVHSEEEVANAVKTLTNPSLLTERYFNDCDYLLLDFLIYDAMKMEEKEDKKKCSSPFFQVPLPKRVETDVQKMISDYYSTNYQFRHSFHMPRKVKISLIFSVKCSEFLSPRIHRVKKNESEKLENYDVNVLPVNINRLETNIMVDRWILSTNNGLIIPKRPSKNDQSLFDLPEISLESIGGGKGDLFFRNFSRKICEWNLYHGNNPQKAIDFILEEISKRVNFDREDCLSHFLNAVREKGFSEMEFCPEKEIIEFYLSKKKWADKYKDEQGIYLVKFNTHHQLDEFAYYFDKFCKMNGDDSLERAFPRAYSLLKLFDRVFWFLSNLSDDVRFYQSSKHECVFTCPKGCVVRRRRKISRKKKRKPRRVRFRDPIEEEEHDDFIPMTLPDVEDELSD